MAAPNATLLVSNVWFITAQEFALNNQTFRDDQALCPMAQSLTQGGSDRLWPPQSAKT